MIITSLENDKIKSLCKLQQKKYRDETNTFLVEGEHLVIEADKANIIKEIIIIDGYQTNYNYPTLISLLPKISKRYSIKSGTTNTDMWIIGYNEEAVLGI